MFRCRHERCALTSSLLSRPFACRVLLRRGGLDRGDGRLCLGILLGCKCVGVLKLCRGAIHFVFGAVLLCLVRGWIGTSTITLKSNTRPRAPYAPLRLIIDMCFRSSALVFFERTVFYLTKKTYLRFLHLFLTFSTRRPAPRPVPRVRRRLIKPLRALRFAQHALQVRNKSTNCRKVCA